MRKDFTRAGAYSNMIAYSAKYIYINIFNKILQMAVPKTDDYNQRGVKWNCSFATWFILSCKQFQFGSVSVGEHCLKLRLNTSEAQWYTEWQFGQLLFQMFSAIRIHTDRNHDFALQSSELARQKNVSQACNLFLAHFIQPIRCFHWQFSSSSMCIQSCCCLCWFSIQIKGTCKFHLHMCTSTKKNPFKRENASCKTFLYFQFLDGFFYFFF